MTFDSLIYFTLGIIFYLIVIALWETFKEWLDNRIKEQIKEQRK